jgi:outer membrane protein assembly factor BamA
MQGRVFDRQSEDLQTTTSYTPKNGRFVLATADLTRSVGSKARASMFGIGSGLLVTPDLDNRLFPRLTARFDIKRDINVNTQLALFSNIGWMDANTPLADQYWLGGSSTLRGYRDIIPTTTYAHATLELRRFLQDVMYAAVFVDVGVFTEGKEIRSLWSPGVSLRYQTPVGPEVRFTAAYAPEQQNWRCEFGFTSAW